MLYSNRQSGKQRKKKSSIMTERTVSGYLIPCYVYKIASGYRRYSEGKGKEGNQKKWGNRGRDAYPVYLSFIWGLASYRERRRKEGKILVSGFFFRKRGSDYGVLFLSPRDAGVFFLVRVSPL